MNQKEIIEDILNLDSNDYLDASENTEETKSYNLLNSKIELMHCTEDTYLKELFSAVQEYIMSTYDPSIKLVSKNITGQVFYSKMISPTLYNTMETKDIYSLSRGVLLGYKNGIVIAMHNLTQAESVFILETVSILRKRLNKPIEISNNILYCTHLITSSNSTRQCKLSHAYVLGILFGKAIVNFNWYLDLFNTHNILSVETITLLNIVRVDADNSDASEMACVYGMSEGFFSHVNITGKIAASGIELIKLLNGTVEKKSKRPTLRIDSYEELYYLILLDSNKPCYLNLFPGRNYIYHIR